MKNTYVVNDDILEPLIEASEIHIYLLKIIGENEILFLDYINSCLDIHLSYDLSPLSFTLLAHHFHVP